eukprot:8275076-Pyramimonas_sp.AAC.1
MSSGMVARLAADTRRVGQWQDAGQGMRPLMQSRREAALRQAPQRLEPKWLRMMVMMVMVM